MTKIIISTTLFERSTVDGRAGMATEPPYPRWFNLTLKDDSTKNFNIVIHKRVVDGSDMEQKVTEKVCRTFGIHSRDVQSVSFYENRLNRPFSHVADELVDGSALGQLTGIDDVS